MSTHLFVYGTLMRGEKRHGYLDGATFIANAHTRPEYRMFDIGDFPGLVPASPGRSIRGELWLVSDAALRRLDEVEAIDEGLYARRRVALQAPFDAVAAETYVYLQCVDALPEIRAHWRERTQ